eukprot:1799832-Rhodomonas_salina.1
MSDARRVFSAVCDAVETVREAAVVAPRVERILARRGVAARTLGDHVSGVASHRSRRAGVQNRLGAHIHARLGKLWHAT